MGEEEDNPLRGYFPTETGNNNDYTDGLATDLTDAPRVGGKGGKVYWKGGSNITLPGRLKSAYALRPKDYKGLMKTEETFKSGLLARFILDVSGKNTNVTLTSWID